MLTQIFSQMGFQIFALGIPILLITRFHVGAMDMGIMRALQTVPNFLFALFIGLIADHIRRKTLLLVADVARALLVLTIPVAWMLNILTVNELFVVVLLVADLTPVI
ncbi:MFS transporter [Sulfobacillus thermosulfidooxidans]|uniref:MFS transporter n=1 Tax=Sulfobacillus thermosulfidooxidans TaxID=28034 RepID=UPI0003F7E2D1|nr:MFS transporter [Sulfobacillus thermosulfidooxidans]